MLLCEQHACMHGKEGVLEALQELGSDYCVPLAASSTNIGLYDCECTKAVYHSPALCADSTRSARPMEQLPQSWHAWIWLPEGACFMGLHMHV